MTLRNGLLALLTLLLAGCATEHGQRQIYQPSGGGVRTEAEQQGGPSGQPQALPNMQITPQQMASFPRTLADTDPGPAVLSLYHQARQQADAGQTDDAEATLERTLRLAQRNAFIWQAMARLDLKLAQYEQAEGEAQRSNSLSHGNPYLQAVNWQIIAAARRGLGDSDGAQKAQQHADQINQALQQASGS
jgi:hypothetical protein